MPTKKPKILIIEDEEFLVKALCEFLRIEFDVAFATDKEETFRHLRSGESFDVILCDLILPGTCVVDVYEEAEK
jgi:two-component system, NtrC family, sensor kinase